MTHLAAWRLAVSSKDLEDLPLICCLLLVQCVGPGLEWYVERVDVKNETGSC